MTDVPADYDPNHPSSAEGEDPDAPEPEIVLEQVGKPSQAEGTDPASTAEEHDVIEPIEPD